MARSWRFDDGVTPRQAVALLTDLTRLPVQTLREVAAYASIDDTVLLAKSMLALDGSANEPIWLKCLLVELLFIQGLPVESMALTSAIGCSDIPEEVAHSMEVARLLASAATDRSAAGRDARDILRGSAKKAGGDHATAAAAVVLAAESWLDGRLEESFKWSAQAMRHVDVIPSPYWQMFAQIEFAARLADIGDTDEARLVQARVREKFQKVGYPGIEQGLALIEAKLLARDGRWSAPDVTESLAAAEAGIATGERIYTPLLLAQLSVVASYNGDAATARTRLTEWESSPGSSSFRSRTVTDWACLLLARIEGDERDVIRVLAALPLERQTALCAQMPGAASWFVRAALVSERADLAEAVVAAAELLRERNPSIAYLATAAQHARGLLIRDAGRVAAAAQDYEHVWPRALAADDLVWQLSQAAASADSPAGSERWRLLTRRERDVAVRVVEGLTNRQIASRLACSPHTVNFHLRNIFRKLDVKTRIEIAPYVLRKRLTSSRDTWPPNPGSIHNQPR